MAPFLNGVSPLCLRKVLFVADVQVAIRATDE